MEDHLFPVLHTGTVRKFQRLNTSNVRKGFPGLRVGDVLKVSLDDAGKDVNKRGLSGLEVGQFVAVKGRGSGDHDIAILLADEAAAASHPRDLLGCRISRVMDTEVTLEVTKRLEGGDP